MKIKLAALWLILFLAAINTICYFGQRQMEEIVPIPSATAPAQTTDAELVTGLCTFGDCPVLLPTQMSVTSPTTETAVHITAPTTEVVKESLTIAVPETGTSQDLAKTSQNIEEPDPETFQSFSETLQPDCKVDREGGRTVTCWVTAYCGCSSCSGRYGNITANGTVCRPNHTVAVDPSVIPYWTQLEIDGIVYTAEDCGSAVNGYEVDIYFENHWETEAWPTGYYEVTIY